MRNRRRVLIPVVCGAMVAFCGGEPPPAPVYQAVPVERREIVVSAEASGVIEPYVTVEVKSKASGEILELLADSGDRVERGTLLLRIDQRQLRTTLAQTRADLAVARARSQDPAANHAAEAIVIYDLHRPEAFEMDTEKRRAAEYELHCLNTGFLRTPRSSTLTFSLLTPAPRRRFKITVSSGLGVGR